MPLALAGATSGSTTLQATDAVTATLTLPSSTGTLLSTANPQSGGVIQVVQGLYNSSTSTSSSTPVATGLTATITPKFSTSKILISFSSVLYNTSATNQAFLHIYKNGSIITTSLSSNRFSDVYSSSGQIVVNAVSFYLDSPATTSATTYAIYLSSASGNVTNGDSGVNQTITLMEIAA